MDAIRKPQGNRKERKREDTGRETSAERDRERKRVAQRERDRGWNIANHRISILMLRGGVNVEGATLGGFEFYIGPTDRFVAAQRLRFESPDLPTKMRDPFS